MTENNPIIEHYQNGSLGTRFKIREQSLKALFASTRNILRDEAFIQLIQDEELDLKREDIDRHLLKTTPSLLVTLSKAIRVKKGYSDLELLHLKRSFVSEIASKKNYTDYYINLLDWIWRAIVGVDEMSTRGARDRAIYFTLMFMVGLSSEQASDIDNDNAQLALEKVYEDYISNEDTDYNEEETLYCLIVTAFMYYEKDDLTNFRYFLMKAKQLNTEEFTMKFVIELLVNEMMED